MKIIFCFISLFCFFASSSIHASIIDSSNNTNWNPGIPGGIPQIEGPVENVMDHGADPSGNNDSRGAFLDALNELPDTGGVVYVPEGNYRISDKITISKSNVVIRGDGYQKTKIFNNHSNVCFEVITYQRGDWQNLVSNFTKGSNLIEVTNGNLFKVGEFAEIQQENDPILMYTDPEWKQSWSLDSVGQMFEVLAIKGNQLTLKTPIHYSIRTNLNPKIRPQGLVTHVGFERFYIEKMQPGNSTFYFKNAAYCWIRAIESYHTRVAHVEAHAVLGCEFRDSYFHHSFSYGGGGSGYGVSLCFHTSDTLCENNVFNHLRHAMIISLGATGCAFGYNYSINPVQGDGETNLNQGWIPPDLSLHGHYAQMNLFEGNKIQEIGIGDYWGPMGPGNTFLRNFVEGEGIFLYDHSHKQNLIGNTSTSWVDDLTSQDSLIHGNTFTGTTQWNPTIIDHTIPNSYYLSDKPSFFEYIAWPVFSNSSLDQIPASKRWASGNPVYDPESNRRLSLLLIPILFDKQDKK